MFYIFQRGSLISSTSSSVTQEENALSEANAPEAASSTEVALSNKETSFTDPPTESSNIKRKGKVETV